MIGRALRIGILLLVTLGLVTACGSSDRPRELSMDDVKACQLISSSDLQQLQVKATPQPVPGISGVDLEGTGCLYRPITGDNVTISKVMNHGIGRWTGLFSDTPAEQVAPIRGFPTINVEDIRDSTGPHAWCTLYIDVADGQSLRVQVPANSKDAPPTCDTARKFGKAAMKTLISHN